MFQTALERVSHFFQWWMSLLMLLECNYDFGSETFLKKKKNSIDFSRRLCKEIIPTISVQLFPQAQISCVLVLVHHTEQI